MPVLTLVPDVGRFYPKGSLASHVIGFVGVDNQPLEGVELIAAGLECFTRLRTLDGDKEFAKQQTIVTLDNHRTIDHVADIESLGIAVLVLDYSGIVISRIVVDFTVIGVYGFEHHVAAAQLRDLAAELE